MSEVVQCQAVTQAGQQCKNKAKPDSIYCGIHKQYAPVTQPPPPSPEPDKPAGKPGGARPSVSREQFETLIGQVNELAARVKKMAPGYKAPPYSPHELINLLKENMHRFTPEMRLDALRELQAGLSGPDAKDLLDLETWKGMWYLLNYSAQSHSRSLFAEVSGRMSRLPGMSLLQQLPGASLVTDLGSMLEGSDPKDFLEVDTWKGMAYLVNYSIQYEVSELRRRVMGDEEEE